jgi:hypothetical protein
MGGHAGIFIRGKTNIFIIRQSTAAEMNKGTFCRYLNKI